MKYNFYLNRTEKKICLEDDFVFLSQLLNLSDWFWAVQEALDVYLKLPQKQYNTGWVLSQVVWFFKILFLTLFWILYLFPIYQ
jgi:hypothetical protein